MEVSRPVDAAARLISVLAIVVGVVAMHTLVTGHHGDSHLTASGATAAHIAAASHSSAGLSDQRQAPASHDHPPTAYITAYDGACLHSGPDQAPYPSGRLLDVCMAIVLAAATAGLLRRHLRGRPPRRLIAARVMERLSPANLPRLNAPNLFQLGILRT